MRRRPEHSATQFAGPHLVIDTTTGKAIEGHQYPENADHAVAVINAHEKAHGRPERYARRDAIARP